MYLIINWFYSLGKISGIVPEPKLKNWKTEFSREIQEEILHMDSVFQFFCFSVLLTELFRNISGDISEYLRETEKLKNWKTEKLKNRKTEFSREIQEEILHMDSVFSVFQFCLRNYSGIFPETFRNICGKLKNWKTEKLNFPERSRKRFFIWIQFFCFSVFLFFSFAYGTIPEYFRRHFGIFAGNWKTEKLKNWIFQRDPGRDSPHGFSFSVFQFFCFSVFLTELSLPGSLWKIQFFSFSVFQFFSFPQIFRNVSGNIPE